MKIPRFIILAVAVATPVLVRAQATYPDSEAAKHVGEEVAITGKVVSVSKSAKGTTFLNFGDRFPRHVFTGMVLARDEAKLGDVKGFEGKTVTITGKIELAPDQKPQILISKPEQIKLADESSPPPPAPAPATPMPQPVAKLATPPPSTPMPAPIAPAPPEPAPSAPEPSGERKIVLAPNWGSPQQGGTMTRKDLAMLFAGHGEPSERLEGDSTIEVYPGIPFLTPINVARKTLKLEGTSVTKTKVSTPGLPIASFSAYSFSGIFLGGFSRLLLVTDNADQIVSAIVIDDNARQRTTELTDQSGYHTYNFVSNRAKGTNDLIIKHAIATEGPAGVLVVESMFIDPYDTDGQPRTTTRSSSGKISTSSRGPRTGKVLERSRWFVPVPIVNLILRCVGSR
ncbi:MAG: hypothetical protein ABMA13_20535 [Chthoniobacteraceae bacterium]